MIVKIREISEFENIGLPKKIIDKFKRNKILPKISYKNVKIVRLPINSKEEAYILYISERPPKYYLFIKLSNFSKEIENEVKTIVNPDEALYIIYTKILDSYSKKIAELSKRLQAEREKLFKGKNIDFDLIEKILKELEDLEDFIYVLNANYSELIKDTTYLQLIDGHIKGIHDSISELYSKIKFMVDMQENLYQKSLNKKIERLTIISTIFLPPTLIASIYGMNFQIDVIPSWIHPYGFTIAIATIILSSIITYLLIKRM